LVRARQIPGVERTASKIEPFVSLIEGLRSRIKSETYDLTEIIDDIIEATGYLNELEEEGTQEAQDRIENIYELKNKLVTYVEEAGETPTLSGFLEEVSLVSDIDTMDDSKDNIVLMTLHSAKGLEFPYVYICGMEEGTFPSYMSINAENPDEEIEEERRLCYVGITRAQKRLSLSAAKFRMIRGEMHYNKPSRFIHEIPRHLLKVNMPEKKTVYTFSREEDDDFYQEASDYHISQTHYKPFVTSEPKNFAGSNLGTIDFKVGDTVKHAKFGIGTVSDIVMGGKDYEVTVDFARFGIKKLLASFANLTKVD
jgi:hypothetical protein